MIDINDNVDISGNLVANGNVDLGNATGDTITATGRFDSHLIPSTDGVIDLGASTLEWKDLFIDGIAHIDTLDVDQSATIAHDLSVNRHTNLDNVSIVGVVTVTNGRADIDNVRIDGNTVTTTTGNLVLDSDGGLVDINDNVDILGTLLVRGNATIGNQSSDSHTFNGSVDLNHTLNVDGDADFNNPVHITDTTANTIGNPNTGALQVDGGVGVNGNITVDCNFDVDGATTLDNTTIDGTLDMNGTATTRLILPDGDNTRDLGSPTARWRDIYGVDFHGNLVGGASQVKTQNTGTNATHFITFVDSNNNSATAETLFTDGGLKYNQVRITLKLMVTYCICL